MRLHLHVDPKESLTLHGTPPGSAIIPEVTAMDVAPVPPPPPPPPPPPLPAPVTPISRLESTRRQRLRNLNWERIPKERVEGRKSVWSGSLTGSEDDDFLIDLHSLDELFGRKESNKSNLNRSFRSSMCPSRSPQDTCNEKISLLDSKRSMNVGIFLRQFKTPASEIVGDVRQGAGESYGAEKLAELCKLLPDREEEARLKKFTGDRTSLCEPDLFMLLLVEVKNVRLRLDAMILQQEFDPALTSLCVAARCLGEAARELLQCHKLHSILRLVLKAGNYMNAGGYAGNAAGFRIASLLKLADTKANKPGVDLLHFVAMEVVKKDEDLLTFPSQLSHVSSASRLSEESVLEDLSRLQSRVAALSNSVQEEPELDQQMRPFLEAAAERLKEAQEEVDNMCKTSQALVEFFCEDESCFKLEEACRIFHCFSHRFQRAVLENSERERKEQKRAERLREHNEKRRSLAVCSSSELDDLESTLERNLSYTWSRRSFRRQSRRLSSLDKSTDSDSQSPIGSEGRDLERILGLEGFRRSPVFRRHTLLRDVNPGEQNGVEMDGRQRECILRPDHDGSTEQNVAAAGFRSAKVSSDDSFVSIDDKICIEQNSDESRVGIKPEVLLEVETRPEMKATVSQDCLNSEEYNIQQVAQADAEAWHESRHLDISPQLAQEVGDVSPSRERAYPRVGESLECHTLVKGLRSYDAMSPTAQRPAPSHCSKWRKELEAEERDGSNSPQSKDDYHTPKMGTRVPNKRGLAPRNGPSNSSSVPKARVKPESSIGEPPSTPRTPLFTPPRSTSMRSSPTARPSNIQAELKRSISTRDKPSDAGVKQNRRPVEKSSPEKDKTPHYESFVRGSPLRVTKRLAPQSDSQNPRTLHSPTSATNAKTVRTAVISAAKAKTSKNTDTVSSKTSPGTRTAGPKIPRATTQPMWR